MRIARICMRMPHGVALSIITRIPAFETLCALNHPRDAFPRGEKRNIHSFNRRVSLASELEVFSERQSTSHSDHI